MKIKEGGFSNPPLHSNPFKGLGNHSCGRGNWHDFNPVEFDGNAHTIDQRIVAAGMRQLGRINVKANSGEFATIASKAALNIINHSLSTIAKGPSRAQVTGQVGQQPESMEIRVLRQLVLQPMGKAQLSEAMGQKTISGQLNKVIRVLVADQTIEPTIPDKPTSRLQKYRLTEKGQRLLEKLGKEGGRL
jgi:hypothetical protein